jgi:hypothetical protein
LILISVRAAAACASWTAIAALHPLAWRDILSTPQRGEVGCAGCGACRCMAC